MVLESASVLEIADHNLWASFAVSLHQNIPTPRAQSFFMFLHINANVFPFFCYLFYLLLFLFLSFSCNVPSTSLVCLNRIQFHSNHFLPIFNVNDVIKIICTWRVSPGTHATSHRNYPIFDNEETLEVHEQS